MGKVVWDDEQPAPARAGVVWDDEPAPNRGTISPLETFGTSYADTATAGLSDELGAVVQALKQHGAKVQKAVPGFREMLPEWARMEERTDKTGRRPLEVLELYRKARGENRIDREVGQEQNPLASKLGIAPGIVASAIVAPGGSAKTVLQGGLKALAKAGAKRGLKSGTAYGALAGLGNSEADLTTLDPSELARAGLDTAVGAGVGAGLGAGTGAILPAAVAGAKAVPAALRALRDKTAETLKKYAELRSYKSAGPMLNDYRLVGEEGARKIGRTLLDSKVVTFGDNVEDVARQIQPIQQKAGQAVGDVVDELDVALEKKAQELLAKQGAIVPYGSTPAGPKMGLSPAGIARRVREEVADVRNMPPQRDIARLANEEADEIAKMPGDLTFKEAQKLVNSYNAKAKYETARPSDVADTYRDIRRVAKNQVEQGADAIDPKLGEKFRKAKENYSNLAPAAEMADDQYLRREANRVLSPTDYIAGAAQLAAGEDGIKAMVVAAIHKQIRERGSSAIAVTTDRISKALRSRETTEAVRQAVVTDPAAFGRLGQFLADTATRNPQAFEAVHQKLLEAIPSYSRLLLGQGELEEESLAGR